MKYILPFNFLVLLASNKLEGKMFRNLLVLFLMFMGMGVSWGQIYSHDFGALSITNKPYTGAPTIFDSNLSNSSWTTSASGWSAATGNAGMSLSLANSSGSPTYTLTFDIASGFQLSIASFNFWRVRSSTGASNWTMSINGVSVGSGTVPTSGASLGTTAVSSAVSGLTGTVTVVLTMSGASGTGTFRLDDFTLFGTVTSTSCTTPDAVTSLVASVASNQSNVTWTNGACYDEMMLVVSSASFSAATPTGNGSSYTANSLSISDGSNTTFDGGKVVYKGTGTSATVTSLTNGTTYNYKMFTRKGTTWTSGIISTATPGAASSATDYFRSNVVTGNWSDVGTWESSADNINWINATLTPTSNANVISIRNGHTVTINASVTVDEVIVLSGGILNASAVMTVNNGSGDDITVESGGRVNYTVAPVYSSSVIRIKTGGIVSIQVSGMTSAGTGVNAITHVYEDGSILEWNLASGTPSASGVTYFPNVTSEIPIFRFAVAPNGNLGGSNPTVINGRIELASGVSISWQGNGTKTFRNGIIGLGGINTMSTFSGTGIWNISGTTAQLGTNGGTSLTLSNTNGIAISGATTATVVGNLNIGTTTNLTVAASGTLNTGGFLTFKSDANGTASLGNSAGTITGNVTVERFIPSGKRAFRLLSPAVTTSNNISQNWQTATHITGGLGTAGLGFDVTETNNPSMFTYDNQAAQGVSGWTPIANTNNTNLIAGVGYRVLIRGDKTPTNITSASANEMNAAITLSATGTLKTGTVALSSSSTPSINNIANTITDGFSLVGNPYQSAVDWNAVTKSGIDATYWAWDPNMGTSTQRGRYVSFNGTTNNYVGTPPSQVGQFIQPGQAFFVKNTGSSAGTLTFEEAHKATTSANVFRTANTPSLGVALYDPNELAIGGYPIDATKAVFSTDYSNELGLGDATKLEAAGENIAWFRNNTKLAIDAAAPVTTSDELVMKTIRLGANKNYTFKIETTNFDTALTPYLVDTFLNTQTAITTSQAYLASFATTSNQASYSEDRFKIVFQTSALSTDDFANHIKLYPNPAKAGGSFYLDGITEATVSVYTIVGQNIPVTVMSQGNAVQVKPSASLSKGVYLVSITTQGITKQVKWIVE